MGIITFYLLSGSFPFLAETLEELQEKIEKGEMSFEGEVWKKISESAKDFVKKCLIVDPDKRWSAS